MSDTITLPNGYDRSKHPLTAEYRYMTVSETKELKSNDEVVFEAKDRTARCAKVLSLPRTWKRSTGVTVSLKYGLYEYFRVGSKNLGLHDVVKPLLVPINPLYGTDLER